MESNVTCHHTSHSVKQIIQLANKVRTSGIPLEANREEFKLFIQQLYEIDGLVAVYASGSSVVGRSPIKNKEFDDNSDYDIGIIHPGLSKEYYVCDS